MTYYELSGELSKVTLDAFADANHSDASSPLCYIIGIVIGNVENDAAFHVFCWYSHRSRRPAKLPPAAEILAASEAVDKRVMLEKMLSMFREVDVQSLVIVYSNNMYHSLSPKRNTVEKSVPQDVNSISLFFESVIDVFAWVVSRYNPTDVGKI